MKYCYKCHTGWKGDTQPGRRDTCDKCGADLHLCLNCRFYNTHKSNDCEANDAEPIVDKEKGNFCEEFQFADRTLPEQGADTTDKTKKKWDDLFNV